MGQPLVQRNRQDLFVKVPVWMQNITHSFIPASLLQTEPSWWSWSASRSDVLQECGRWRWTARLTHTDERGWSGRAKREKDFRFYYIYEWVCVCFNIPLCLSLPLYLDPWSQHASRGRVWLGGRNWTACPTAESCIFLQSNTDTTDRSSRRHSYLHILVRAPQKLTDVKLKQGAERR